MSRDLAAFRTAHQRTLAHLYAQSRCPAWEISEEAFAEALLASVEKRFPSPAQPSEIDRYLETLHVADLGLACACRDGHEAAWEHFVREYRSVLYAAARALGPRGREAADSLYGELFGMGERDGVRRSLFTYYHGRSRLTTWLRSVLAQRCVDLHRSSSRFDPLDETVDPRDPAVAAPPPPPDPLIPDRVAWVQAALDDAVDALADADRLRLRCYYAEGMTLAQIGRLTGEHEATVSRKLERTRQSLRRSVEAALLERHKVPASAISECLADAVAAPELHLDRLLAASDESSS